MHKKQLSHKHSANCFLNSLFREWTDFYHDKESSTFIIKLKDEGQIVISVDYFSFVGRHSYSGEFFFRKNNLSQAREISFNELTVILLDHLSSIFKTNPEQLRIFLGRVSDSVNNIEATLDMRAEDLALLYKNESIDFKEAEQGLIIGHTFHPHPKNRDEFSAEDYKLYSPEAGGKFSLHWFMVHPDIVHSHISKNFEQKKWNEEIYLKDMLSSNTYNDLKGKGYLVYPIHPWQKNIILKMPLIKEYVSEGLVVDLGVSDVLSEKWHPTSSLRSVYKESSPYMLKFSLSVRLTNSIRHLLPLEVVRGPQVLDVFSTESGATFLKKYSQFKILFEPAYMAITDRSHKILNETIVALRMNPFMLDSTQKLVLATLTQDNPLEGPSLIGHQIKRAAADKNKKIEDVASEWFAKYLTVTVKPLLMAQANYGVLLGAHQQNLILEIKDNMPFSSYFRDCQGTGYSKTGFELFAGDVELMTIENGNILDDKMGNTLFSYYLIINSTFNVIGSIAKDTGTSEEHLIKMLKAELISWKEEGVKDPSCFNYLLESPQLLQKGNFLCSFVNMNENTTENPLGIYNSFPNPIFETIL